MYFTTSGSLDMVPFMLSTMTCDDFCVRVRIFDECLSIKDLMAAAHDEVLPPLREKNWRFKDKTPALRLDVENRHWELSFWGGL